MNNNSSSQQARRPRWTVALGCAALCFSTALAGSGCKGPNHESQKAAAPAPLAPLWPAGAHLTYSFGLTSSTSLGALPAAGDVHLSGLLVVAVESVSGPKVTLRVAPQKLTLERPRGVEEKVLAELTQDLQRPFALELEAGVLVAYLEPKESSLLAFGLRRQLAVLMQRAEPASGERSRWSGQEWDSTGRATVHYQADSAQSGLFTWKKDAYTQVLAHRGAQSALKEQSWKPEVLTSTGMVRVDQKGALDIDHEETLRTELMREQYLRTSYRARLKRLEQTAPPVPQPSEPLVRRRMDEAPPPMQTDALDAVRFAGKSWDEVLAGLPKETAASADSSSFGARQAGFHALVGLLRTDEDNVTLAEGLIRRGDPRTGLLLRALGAAGTPGALNALTALSLDKKRADAERLQAAGAFLRAETPSAQALQSLLSFLKEPLLKEHAILGLGTFGRRYREGGLSVQADEASKALGAELKRAKTAQEKESCLLAVANSGDVSFFDQVVEFQADAEPAVREAAIQAVRLMPDARVEPTLVGLLIKSDESRETLAILSALEQRKLVTEATLKLVETRAQADEDAAVRRQAALTLAAWRGKWPQVLKTLEVLAAKDPDARVREAAQRRSTL